MRLSVVAENSLWCVDHPLLRVGVAQHPLGEGAQANEVVSQGACERCAILLGKLCLLPVEGKGVVGLDLLVDDARGSLAALPRW